MARKIPTNGFDKNPQNINRYGANRKTYTSLINSIKEKGFVAPSKSEYYNMIGLLLVMNEAEMKDFLQNKDNPQWLRWLIADLSNAKTRQKMQSDYRDWLFGKAEQIIENKNTSLQIVVDEETKKILDQINEAD